MTMTMPEDTDGIGIPEQEEGGKEQLILSTQGNPFKSANAARSVIDKKGLDPNKFVVKEVQDGFAIVRKTETKEKEKYYRVTFNQRSDPKETEDVEALVNGEPLILQRGVPTIIPERYKVAFDNATRDVFVQKPNHPRKIVGQVQLYPYALAGEATKKEYDELKAEGNRLTRKSLDEDRKLVS